MRATGRRLAECHCMSTPRRDGEVPHVGDSVRAGFDQGVRLDDADQARCSVSHIHEIARGADGDAGIPDPRYRQRRKQAVVACGDLVQGLRAAILAKRVKEAVIGTYYQARARFAVEVNRANRRVGGGVNDSYPAHRVSSGVVDSYIQVPPLRIEDHIPRPGTDRDVFDNLPGGGMELHDRSAIVVAGVEVIAVGAGEDAPGDARKIFKIGDVLVGEPAVQPHALVPIAQTGAGIDGAPIGGNIYARAPCRRKKSFLLVNCFGESLPQRELKRE